MTHRDHVARLVRELVPAQYRGEGEQVGCVGLLIALQRYEPALCTSVGGDRGAAFWNFARPYVRDEIRSWLGVGVYWRKDANRGQSAARRAAAADARRQRTQDSLDAPTEHGATLHDMLSTTMPTVEEQVSEAELHTRLREFAATLSSDELALLFSDDPRRVRSRHHLSLVERARAFVRGSDDRADPETSCRRIRAIK